MNAHVLTKVAIWVLLAGAAGCASSQASQESERYQSSAPIQYHPGPAFVVVPAGAPPESLRWAVEAALSERHWNIDSRSPGRIQASVHSNGSGENATILVTYGPVGIQVLQVAAAVSPKRYDRWVRLLVTNLNAHVAEIGMGRGAPWAAPPGAAPPPVAAPPAAAPPPAATPPVDP